jgi:hypothetical protein
LNWQAVTVPGTGTLTKVLGHRSPASVWTEAIALIVPGVPAPQDLPVRTTR